jgi:hypothetical protein
VPLLGLKTAGREQGFITDRNRFVDRAEARHIAHAAGQVDSDGDSLLSEQLWEVPDAVFMGRPAPPSGQTQAGEGRPETLAEYEVFTAEPERMSVGRLNHVVRALREALYQERLRSAASGEPLPREQERGGALFDSFAAEQKERMEAERQLDLSRKRERELVEALRDCVAILQDNPQEWGRKRKVLAAARRVLGDAP